jgi:hypothetical protein
MKMLCEVSLMEDGRDISRKRSDFLKLSDAERRPMVFKEMTGNDDLGGGQSNDKDRTEQI